MWHRRANLHALNRHGRCAVDGYVKQGVPSARGQQHHLKMLTSLRFRGGDAGFVCITPPTNGCDRVEVRVGYGRFFS